MQCPARPGPIVGIIPARWASTRFPGKMLAPIRGAPLIEHVVRRVQRCRRLDGLLVATDDERIRAAADALGVEAVMTRADHPSGTDRIAEVAAARDAAGWVNIQGDEPLIDPALVDEIADTLRRPEGGWDMVTAATPYAGDPEDPDKVKVVCARDGAALYFSRSRIPYRRDAASPPAPVYRHLGLYGYRTEFLLRLTAEPPCALEQSEKLEQLRALYLGGRIRVILCEDRGIGVDRPEDIAVMEALLAKEIIS